jgi:Kef-type K+ transport system membrane component KefB
MAGITTLLFDLFLIVLVAKLAAEVCERLHQPTVIGELLAGVLIGPYALGLIGTPDATLVEAFHGDVVAAQEGIDLVYHLIAELGIVVLLFCVGLETRIADIWRVGARAATVAVLGVVIPFALGYGLMGPVLGHPTVEAIFVGAALVATSVGITARVLRDLGMLASIESRIVLGAAIIDDILAMIILAVVAGLATTGSIRLIEIGAIAGQAVAFTAFVSLVGTGAMRRFGLGLSRLKMEGAPLAASLVVMLGLAALSASIGLAAIIGAFLAGMVFAEAREHFDLERQTVPIYQFLVPFFFVLTGAQVDWRLFFDGGIMSVALAVTGLALLGKVIGCGLGVLGLGWRSIATVGVGMAPRGEVGLIVASLGLSLAAIPREIFNVVVLMSILTTLVVPPILTALTRARPVAVEPGMQANAPALADANVE